MLHEAEIVMELKTKPVAVKTVSEVAVTGRQGQMLTRVLQLVLKAWGVVH